MTVLWIVLITMALLWMLYLLALRGRKGHPGLSGLRRWNYAHRGLHNESRPENSMAAFRAALEAGCGIELDIHLTKDGELAVIHDSSLKRVAGADVMIEDLNAADLKKYALGGTAETVPLFRDVLALFAGKAPLIVELKSAKGNQNELAEKAAGLLDSYPGSYCIESFDPKCVHWFKKNRPDVVRGQLSANFLKDKGNLPWIVRFIMTHNLLNFWTQPDFIAYKFQDRCTLSNRLCRGLHGVQGVAWTLRTQEEHKTALREGWIPIFENFLP